MKDPQHVIRVLQTMSINVVNRIATVAFQRPAKLNAVHALMHTDLVGRMRFVYFVRAV